MCGDKREGRIRRRLKGLEKVLKRSGYFSHTLPDLSYQDGVLRITGDVKNWEAKVFAGSSAAALGFSSIVNDLVFDGEECELPEPESRDGSLDGTMYDLVIIGGGVTGCALAQRLCRYDLKILIVEKESDLAMHASGRNDGMVHPGFAASPGSKKAYYNVRGNRMYDQLSRDLGIDFHRPGSMILFPSRWYLLILPIMRHRARKNGVDGYRYLSPKQVRVMEPYITEKQRGAFFLPSAGVLSPYRLVNAMAEHALMNGVELALETQVSGFEMSGEESRKITAVKTNRGRIYTRAVVNASGIWADKIADFAGDRFFSLHGRKGVDAILDRSTAFFQKRIAAMPNLIGHRNAKTKGGGIVPTIEGNLLIGPTAKEVPKREDYSTEQEDLSDLFKRLDVNPSLSPSHTITYFAGIRACTWDEDFIVERSKRVENLVHLAGIQSPGLASAPAIAEDAECLCLDLLDEGNGVPLRTDYRSRRKAPLRPDRMTDEERDRLIASDPAYGRIVCRCEAISEGEIRDVLRSPVPVRTLDGVKRRARAGTGRCHGGFCTPRILEIMARELGCRPDELTKRGGASLILEGSIGGDDCA